MREGQGKPDSQQIIIIINRKDLETSKEETYKINGESKLEDEPISLIPFEEGKEEKEEKKGKKRAKSKIGRSGNIDIIRVSGLQRPIIKIM